MTQALKSKYGRLTPIRFVERRRFPCGKTQPVWDFQCDCGKTTRALLNLVKRGHTQSCGCYGEQVRSEVHTKHGGCKGDEFEPLYNVWRGMIQRCNDPNCRIFKRYGARGIKVVWRSYAEFRKDMQDTYRRGLQIERVDNDGDYKPANCRWATVKEQARNRRTNINLTFRGKTQCLKDWSFEVGIKYETLRHRLHAGWTVKEILTEPLS